MSAEDLFPTINCEVCGEHKPLYNVNGERLCADCCPDFVPALGSNWWANKDRENVTMESEIEAYKSFLDQKRLIQRELSDVTAKINRMGKALAESRSGLRIGDLVKSKKSGKIYEIARMIFTRSQDVVLDCLPIEANGHRYSFTDKHVEKCTAPADDHMN